MVKDKAVDLIRDCLAADSTSKRAALSKGKVVLIRDRTVDLIKGQVEETVLIRDKEPLTRGRPMP